MPTFDAFDTEGVRQRLLAYLADSHNLDFDYIGAHTTGFEAALAQCRAIAPDVDAVAKATGLADSDILQFYSLFASIENVVTCYSQGVNQSAQGTDKVNAILNCHLATGRIGKPGTGPFSLTGQPNAMGGREVGGLANQLAAHMNFTPADIESLVAAAARLPADVLAQLGPKKLPEPPKTTARRSGPLGIRP